MPNFSLRLRSDAVVPSLLEQRYKSVAIFLRKNPEYEADVRQWSRSLTQLITEGLDKSPTKRREDLDRKLGDGTLSALIEFEHTAFPNHSFQPICSCQPDDAAPGGLISQLLLGAPTCPRCLASAEAALCKIESLTLGAGSPATHDLLPHPLVTAAPVNAELGSRATMTVQVGDREKTVRLPEYDSWAPREGIEGFTKQSLAERHGRSIRHIERKLKGMEPQSETRKVQRRDGSLKRMKWFPHDPFDERHSTGPG